MSNNNGYPVSKAVAAAACAKFGPFPGGPSQVLDRPYSYWHSRNIKNDGSETSLEFFNEAKAASVTNMQQQGVIPSNYVFGVSGIRCSFLCGIDRLGSRVASTALNGVLGLGSDSATTAPEINVPKWYELVRQLLETATLSFKVAEREILTIKDLTNFPDGGSVVGPGFASSAFDSAAAAEGAHTALAQIGNGAPFKGNVFHFPSPYPLVGGQNFSVSIDWPAGVDFTLANVGPLEGETAGNTAGTLTVALDGELITPASN